MDMRITAWLVLNVIQLERKIKFLDLKAYEGNPYGYLINLAILAQQDGIVASMNDC